MTTQQLTPREANEHATGDISGSTARGAIEGSRPERPHRRRDERGEGVISTAISVLVVAALGVAMWVAFSNIFQDVSEKTNGQVEQIGETP
jgi:hypothetical protein